MRKWRLRDYAFIAKRRSENACMLQSALYNIIVRKQKPINTNIDDFTFRIHCLDQSDTILTFKLHLVVLHDYVISFFVNKFYRKLAMPTFWILIILSYDWGVIYFTIEYSICISKKVSLWFIQKLFWTIHFMTWRSL